MFVQLSYFFEHLSSYEHFLAKRQGVDTGSPAGHIGRGPGAIRVLWSAWQAPNVVCFGGSGQDDFPGFSAININIGLICTYVTVKFRNLFALS